MDDLSIIAVKRALLEQPLLTSSNLSRLPLPPVTPPKKQAVEKELNEILTKVQNDIQQIKNNVLANLSSGESIDPEQIKVLFEQAEKDIEGKKQDVVTQFNNKALTSSKLNLQNSHQPETRSLENDEKPQANKKQSNGHTPSPGQKTAALHKLKSIINPARADARMLLNRHYGVLLPTKDNNNARNKKLDRSLRPLTGSTVAVTPAIPKENRINSRLTPPPPPEEDKRKGVIHLIERKIIPASSHLSISPSPLKQKKVVLHEPLDIKKYNQDKAMTKLSYNMALVRFDKNTLRDAVDLTCKRSITAAGDCFAISNEDATESNVNLHLSNLETNEDINLHQTSMNTELTNSSAPLQTILSDPKNRQTHKFLILNGQAQKGKRDFVLFKQYYCLSWGSIISLLQRVEKLLVDYSIPIAIIDGDRLADLALYFEVGPKPTIKDLLMCVRNIEEVEKFILIPGRRYMAPDGVDRAVLKIQATWRCHKQNSAYLVYRRKKWAAGMIALSWIMRCKMTMIRNEIKEKHAVNLQSFRSRAKFLQENWSKLKNSKRVVVHIPSLGYSSIVRESMHNIATIQNNQIGRICDIQDPNVEIIYISPVPMTSDLQDYYHRLIDVMARNSNQDSESIRARLKIITPHFYDRFPAHNLCLSTVLKYSSVTMERVKRLLKGKDAYIVPGMMHNDDVYIAEQFDIPVLGSEPEVAQLYSMKSGVCRIFEGAGVTVPPGDHDIYSVQQIYQSLARLVTENLHIKRWLLKMDSQIDGKGTAYCDVIPFLTCYVMALKEQERYGDRWHQPWAYESTYNNILLEMPRILKHNSVVIDQSLFPTWLDFVRAFCRQGGVIQACPPVDSVTGLTSNVLIEPDGNVNILNVADQVHSSSAYRCWGHTLPQCSIQPEIVNKSILSISESCKTRGIIGYVSIDFVTFIDPESGAQVLWAVDLKNTYTSSNSMIHLIQFLTDHCYDCQQNVMAVKIQRDKRPNPAYRSKRKKKEPVDEAIVETVSRYCVLSPNLYHTNLNNVQYQVFFQICKAHGIGYDEKFKLGTCMTLLDRVRRESIGMLTLGETLEDAVRSFACNLQIIHRDISSPVMKGKNNFQGAIEDLKSILASLHVNHELDQDTYPTLDPLKQDRQNSQSSRRSKSSSPTKVVTNGSVNDLVVNTPINTGRTPISEGRLTASGERWTAYTNNSSVASYVLDNRYPSTPISDDEDRIG